MVHALDTAAEAEDDAEDDGEADEADGEDVEAVEEGDCDAAGDDAEADGLVPSPDVEPHAHREPASNAAVNTIAKRVRPAVGDPNRCNEPMPDDKPLEPLLRRETIMICPSSVKRANPATVLPAIDACDHAIASLYLYLR